MPQSSCMSDSGMNLWIGSFQSPGSFSLLIIFHILFFCCFGKDSFIHFHVFSFSITYCWRSLERPYQDLKWQWPCELLILKRARLGSFHSNKWGISAFSALSVSLFASSRLACLISISAHSLLSKISPMRTAVQHVTNRRCQEHGLISFYLSLSASVSPSLALIFCLSFLSDPIVFFFQEGRRQTDKQDETKTDMAQRIRPADRERFIR